MVAPIKPYTTIQTRKTIEYLTKHSNTKSKRYPEVEYLTDYVNMKKVDRWLENFEEPFYVQLKNSIKYVFEDLVEKFQKMRKRRI